MFIDLPAVTWLTEDFIEAPEEEGGTPKPHKKGDIIIYKRFIETTGLQVVPAIGKLGKVLPPDDPRRTYISTHAPTSKGDGGFWCPLPIDNVIVLFQEATQATQQKPGKILVPTIH